MVEPVYAVPRSTRGIPELEPSAPSPMSRGSKSSCCWRWLKRVCVGVLLMVMLVLVVGWVANTVAQSKGASATYTAHLKFEDLDFKFVLSLELRRHGNNVVETLLQEPCGWEGLKITGASRVLVMMTKTYLAFDPQVSSIPEPVFTGDVAYFADVAGRLKLGVVRDASGRPDEALIKLGRVTGGLKELVTAAGRLANRTSGAVLVEC